MNIPYSSPNLRAVDFFCSLFISSGVADKKIKGYFSELTRKKHIVITNSCRSALYLAYIALRKQGEVITSPLTCKVAIDPIVESGNKPVFADISPGDLNIRPDDIEHRITDKTVAIQAIHLGGISCDMEKIMTIARKRNLKVLEDCAQSLGANYNGRPTGSFGDVACFSLIKNAYGIGGGILATDDYEIYKQAQKINDGLAKVSIRLVAFRIVRNLLATKRRHWPFCSVHKMLMDMRRNKKGYTTVKNQLRQAANMENKIVAQQMGRWPLLHEKRKQIGKKYFDILVERGLMDNKDFKPEDASFTKFFVYNQKLDSRKLLKTFAEYDMEAMHLEQKHGSPCQGRLMSTGKSKQLALNNYDDVHDKIVSLPLCEFMSDSYVNCISTKLAKEINTER